MADWVSIKAEYIAGAGTLKELAEQHGVCYPTLRKIAANEKWRENRTSTEHLVNKKVQDVIVQKVAKHAVDRLTRLLAIGDNITDNLEKATSITPLERYDFKTFATTLKTLQDVAKASDQRGEAELLSKANEILGGVPSAID